jgi:hypothetical protein
VGVALWLGCGVAAFVLARIVPIARRQGWLAEMTAAIVTAMLFGVVATALDFGGWKEMDWRAGVFAALGAVAAVGTSRAVRG